MARFIESTKEINKAARKQRKPKQQKPKQQKPKQNASANKPASNKPTAPKTGGNKNKAGGSQYSVKQDRQITSRQTQAPKNNSVNRSTRANTNRATQRYSTNVRNGSQYSVANSANRRATRNYKQQQNNRFESRKNELKDSNILKSTKTATNNDIRRMGGAQYKVDNSSRKTEFGKKIADAERRAKLGLKGGTIEVLGSLANYIAENTDDKFGNRERDRYALQYATGQISEKELNQKYKELDDRWNSEKKTLQKAADDTANLKLYGTALKEEGRKGLTGINKTLYDGLSSIPYMAITRAAGPAWRLVTYMAGAGGDLADKKQMYENGEITDFERRKSSILSGGIETVTESAFGALTPLTNLPGAGTASKGLDDIILRGIDAATMNIRNGFLKNVAGSAMKLGAAGAEEAVEELAASVLEVPAENISYRNRMDRDYRANLGSNTSALDEQVDYFISKGLTREEAVRFILESVNSEETLDAIISDYVNSGLSEKNAKRQAKNLQEYMSAHLSGDKEAKQAAEDKLAKGIKAEFSWKDANEAMAAAFAATVMTGAGTSAFSTFNGMNIKNQFEKVAGTKSAAETITEAAIKKGLDESLASRAQAMNEHAKSGKDLSYEQYAELGNAILAQTVSNSKKANIAIKSAKEIADSESFYVMPGAVKSENGEYRFGQKSIVADEDGKLSIGINPGGVTENKAQLTRAALNEIVNRIESESGKTLEDKDSFVEEMVSLNCGYATPYTVDYLTEASPEYRSAYEEYFGQALPKDNEQMREFVYKQSAANLVESAKAETIDKIDTDKGFYDVQTANHLGEEGQQTLQAISDNIGVLDSMSYIQHNNQLIGAYEEGRNGASLGKVLELYSDVRGLDRASVEAMYQAGVTDKARGSNTGSVVYDVSDKSKIRNSHRDTMLAFSRIFGVRIVVTDALTIEKANKIENKQSIEESDNVGSQVNGMFYDNTIYINLNDDIRKPIGYTIMHELTHNIEQRFPAEYKAFADLFKQRWIEKNSQESFDKAIKDRISTYDNAGAKLTEEDALSEIIADQMAEVLYDEEFISNIAEEHPNIARAILDSIRDIIRKIRQLFANYGGFRSEFNEATLSQLDMLKDAEVLLVKAINAAQDGRTQEILGDAKKFSVDSNGNNLSPQQAEYFKDSKVRDEDGNLLVMYHGTKADFTVFDKNYIGGTGRFEGAGFNFTSFEGRAMSYDTSGEGKVFRTYLNIKNPLSDSERTITKSKLKKIVSGIAQREDIEGYDSIIFAVTAPYGKNIDEDYNRSLADTVDYLWRSCKTDADIYSQISTLGTNDEVVIDEFEKEGFDGLIWHDDGTISTVIAFEPEQIKSVDNKQPTLNPDIRFSIPSETIEALDSDGVGITDGGTAVRYSLSSWLDSDRAQLLNNLVSAGYDRADAKKWINDVSSVASIIAADKVRLDYEADQDQKALKPNGEYYYTLDLSTLCQKRRLYQGTYNAIMHRLVNYALTPEDTIEIRAMMDELGFEVPCGICYEESRKKNEGIFAERWLNGYGKKWAGYKNMEHDDPYIPTLDEVTTTDGRAKLKKEHPEALESYLAYQRTRGSANPKVSFTHTDYRGDILELTENDIKKVKHIGGLRIQSFSDLEMVHIIDMMQAVVDMASRNLTAQAYTKVPAFADIFGGTGIKINLSLIGRYNEETGQLEFDAKEGIDPDEAFRIREKYSKNVGTILVGADDISILKAWADDRIDMVIPFHRSGWKVKEFKKLGLNNYRDYTRWQSERYMNGKPNGQALSRASKDKGIPMNPIYSEDYWDYTKTGKENAEAYLKLCAEKKYIPVFSNFLVNNGDGSYSLQPDGSTDGYWKSLVDFKMYDNDGVGSPQQEVKPEFDMEAAQKHLDSYEGNADTLPVAEEVVDKFLEKYKEKHPGAKFSIVEDSNGEYNVDELETSLKERFKEYETDEENLKLATEAIADIGKIRLSIDGDIDDVRRNTSGIRTIAKGISEQFINEGYVDFRGRKVNGPEDVAAMMQVCRDPRFETFRIILVKGNKVVSVRNMSSRLPGMSAAFEHTDAQESFELMKDRMRRSQADGYYLVHNHPSGQVKASSDDKMVTAMYINKVPGFKGHIILDHNKYGLIENIPEYDNESGYTLPKASEIETGGQLTIDFMNIPEVEHRMLGKSAGNKSDSVANTIKQIQTSKTASIVLYADSQLKVREIQEIDNVVIENQRHLKSYIFNEGVRCGARCIFVGSYKFETYSVLREMVKDGVLTDAFMLFDSIDARSARVDDSAVPLVNEDAIAKNRGFVLYDGTKDYENNSLAEVIPSKESVIQYSIDNPWDTSWFDGILDDEEVNTRGDKNKSIAEISAEFTNIVRDNAKLTGGKVLDRKSIKNQIGELVKMTTKDTTYTATEKREIANFLLDTAEQIWSITGEKRPMKLKQEEIDRIINLLYDASDYVISNAKYINDAMLDEIIEFKKFFRGREVGVSAGARAELADDWDTIRKRNFGRVKFVSAEKYGVTNIADALIQTFPEAPEISLLYGREVEEALEIGDEATLVRILDDVLSNLSVVDDAIKSEYAEDFRVALSQDFARIVLNEGEAWESKMDRFKDRYEQRIKDLRARQKEAVRDLRRDYEKLLAEQNATFKKKLAETKAKSEARLQAEKDKQKAKEQKRKDSEQRKKIRNRIAEDYNWLAQRLVKPKKDDFKHIPSDFVESVANLLEIFDFQTERSLQLEEKRGYASGATEAMRELRDKISKYSSPDGGNIFVRNDALDVLVDECIEFLDGRALRELEDHELQKVSEMLRAVRHMVKTQNELFVANRKATVAEAGESIISESAKKMEKYGRRYDRTGISGKLSHLLNETMMTPGNFFDSLGGTMKALYKNLRNAQDDYIMKVKFLRDFYKDLLGGYYKKAKPGSAVEDWQTQTNEFTLSDGSKLNITVAQVMSLYCLSKREQALGHILGSGIVLSDVTLDKGVAKVLGGKIQNTASGYRMTHNDVMNVISSLTDEQRRIADAIQNLMNTTLKDWGNETSLRLFDMEFFTEENYFPISVEQSELATEIGKGTEIKGNRITSFGMTKPLTEHANNKIIIGDIFSIAADHCNKMALYSAYAPSLIDFNRVYNYKQRNEDGTTGYTVKGILKDAYSNKALKFIDNILDDINGQAQPRTDGLTAMINTSLANYKKAAIGLNMRVLVQQPTAIMRSLYMINPKYFTSDCFVGLKSAREEMHEHCPISAWKAWGNYQNDYTKNFEDVMLNKDWSKFDAVTMGMYGWADDMTWAVIWNAVKNEVKHKNPDVEVGSEEYWKLCNERASDVYDETQVVDSVFHRSDAMRNPDKLSKVVTSFMAEPTRTYNMVRSSIVKAYRSHKDGDNKAAAAELNKMLVVVVLNAAAVSAAAAVIDAFRGKGDDDDDETWLETFYRNFGENFKDNVNMLHNIVYVKDVVSFFENAVGEKYFSPSNMVFDGWVKLAKGVGDYDKVLSGDKSFIEWISGDFGAGIGYVTGIPTATFIKDTKALWNRLSLPTFASDGAEEETPSLWDYENNPLEVTDGTWADNVLNFFGINLTPEERAERDFKRTLESVKNKTKNLSGAEKKEAVNKIVMEGYTSLVEDGDFAKLKQMRRIIEAAGGDVEAFDDKVTKRTASEYKKTIGIEADMAKQAEMRQYLLENGWTEAKISGEIVYKSNLAKDFKKACRELDIEKGTDVLTYLILAGITEADAYKLWENRNRGNFDTYSTGKYIAPTNGQITSGFGYRSSPTAGASSYHQGIDIAASRGSVVSAADGGRVVYAGYNGGYGNQIVIQHDDGTQTYYSHLDHISVRKGQSVSQKQYIGNVGSTGISTGPHLDFRVNVGGQFVDPLKYFSV